MQKSNRAWGFFALGLGVSLAVTYWLKKNSLQQAPAALPAEDVHIVLSKEALDAAEDNLTQIDGIEVTTARTLHSLGITSFEALAAASPEALTEKLTGSFTIEQITRWIEQAKQA